MIPPNAMNFVGAGDFEAVGAEFKKHFIELTHMKPSDRVLDVGCGIGRMAVPLTNYLTADGEYHGFDIVPNAIAWCQEKITPKFNNFQFYHADIYNKEYNPKGRKIAESYKFPFQDNYFDTIVLVSVFTHMLPNDLENYLSEISRVLKPEGKSCITYFLLNDESRKLISENQSTLDFKHKLNDCLIIDEKYPESAIAYDENVIVRLYREQNMNIEFDIKYGSWCSRNSYLSYQDIVIASKCR